MTPSAVIPREKLFIQITYKELLRNLWLVLLFRVNCEIYISDDLIDSCGEADLGRTGRILSRYRIGRRLHAPLCDDPREAYKKSVRVSRALGIVSIVMHLEYGSSGSASPERWFEERMGAWEWISRSASEDKVEILIENHEESSAEPFVKMLGRLNSPSVSACYDVGHYNVFGDKAIPDHLGLYEGVAVKEVHLSDNMGDRDSHLPLGKGKIDFPAFFASMDAKGLNPVCTIEAKDLFGVIGGVRYLKRIKRI